MRFTDMTRYRSAWISDVHLGTKGSNASALLAFLRDNDFETLYVIGDLIDIWALKRVRYWPQEHNDVIQKLLRKGRKGTRVIYIPGNHDEFVGNFHGHYGGVQICRHAIHETADGRRLFIMHGHELDTVVQNIRWLAFVGDIGYKMLLRLNGTVNTVRRMFGKEYWSLSSYVKMRVKDAVSFIGKFEEAVVRYAREYDVHGVVCGHIHAPAMRMIGDTEYLNSGDWVETCSALVEDFEGKVHLLTDLHKHSDPVLEDLEDFSEEVPVLVFSSNPPDRIARFGGGR